jgi:L-threonylcarbamoyladenylate synthase
VRMVVPMPADARKYAAQLYGVLHELDAQDFDWIAVDSPDDDPEWDAIRDRLRRAASSGMTKPR